LIFAPPKLVTIDEACALVTDGTHYTPLDVGVGVPFLTVKDISDRSLDFVGCAFISEPAFRAAALANCAPQLGDVLFSKDGTVGKVHVVTADRPFAVLSSIAILRPNRHVDSRYLAHALRDPTVLAEATRRKTGSAIRRIVLSDLKRVLVPIPPLAEQRRIADILDRADALRGKRQAALANLDVMAKSFFVEMFGDPRFNPRQWPIAKLGAIGTLDRGVSKHRPRNAPELLGGPHPLVQTGEVANSDGYIRSHNASYSNAGLRQSRLWPAGTLCITIAANIARAGILTFDACFPDSVVGFRADDPATVEFVRIWLSFVQRTLEDAAPESAQKNINLSILRGLDIPTPPIDLQRQFAARLGVAAALQSACRDSATALDALSASIQHRAFRGDL
jgi:type I restriction enzyme S subunit